MTFEVISSRKLIATVSTCVIHSKMSNITYCLIMLKRKNCTLKQVNIHCICRTVCFTERSISKKGKSMKFKSIWPPTSSHCLPGLAGQLHSSVEHALALLSQLLFITRVACDDHLMFLFSGVVITQPFELSTLTDCGEPADLLCLPEYLYADGGRVRAGEVPDPRHPGRAHTHHRERELLLQGPLPGHTLHCYTKVE